MVLLETKTKNLFGKDFKNSSQKKSFWKLFLRTVVKNNSQLLLGIKLCLGIKIWNTFFLAYSQWKYHTFMYNAKGFKVLSIFSTVDYNTIQKKIENI